MHFLDCFKNDYYRMTGIKFNPSSFKKNYIKYHNIRFMYHFRRYQSSNNIFDRFMLEKYKRKYGLEISVNSTIGEGLYLGHAYNITINGEAVIGKNVNIHKGVTIGCENRGTREGAPTIGDRVYIGVNSTVVGKITIGDNVMIAPNTFVNFDVPANSIVVGNKARIITDKEDATKGYIGFCV